MANWTRKQHSQITFTDWDDEDFYGGVSATPSGTAPRKSLSDFWRGRYSAWGHDDELLRPDGSENPVEFARHLRALRDTCKLIFGTKTLTVNWATQDLNATDIASGNIVISPRFLKEKGAEWKDWTVSDRVDAAHGAAMHEGAHNKWTPQNAMEECQRLGGPALAEMFNIMEDGYIEAEVMFEWPGFTGYIEQLWGFYLTPDEVSRRTHALEDTNMDMVKNPTTEEEYAVIKGQVSAFIMMMIAYLKSRNTVDLTDAALKSDRHAEVVQALERIGGYYDEMENTGVPFEDRMDAAQATLRELAKLFPKTYDPNEEGEGEPSAFALSGEEFKDFLHELMKKSGVGNAAGKDATGNPSAGDKKGEKNSTEALSQEGEATISGILEADLREHELEKFHMGSRSGQEIDKANIVTMNRTPGGDRIYQETVSEIKNFEGRLRKALRFRSADRVYTERERPFGKIDPSRLHNLSAFKDRNIFSRKITASAEAAHVGILTDESGSMGSSAGGYITKEHCARQATMMMARTMINDRTVSLEVWGHTGDIHDSYGTWEQFRRVQEVREPGSPVHGARMNGPLLMKYIDTMQGMVDPRVLGRITARGNNFDGYAIEVVGKSMLENAPDKRKILFVICDGMPAGYGYENPKNVEHTRSRVNILRKNGVQVICLFVGSVGRAEEQMNQMYGRRGVDWVQVVRAEELAPVIEKISGRLLAWDGSK